MGRAAADEDGQTSGGQKVANAMPTVRQGEPSGSGNQNIRTRSAVRERNRAGWVRIQKWQRESGGGCIRARPECGGSGFRERTAGVQRPGSGQRQIAAEGRAGEVVVGELQFKAHVVANEDKVWN